MKRIFSALLLVLMLVTACAPVATPAPAKPEVSTEATKAPEQPAAAETVTLQFGHWDQNMVKVGDELIAAFEKTHPNIKVTQEVMPWDAYFPKLQATLLGEEAFDVFWMDTYNFIDYATRGAMMDLTPYLAESNIDLNKDFGETRTKNVTVDGKIYAIPRDSDDPAVYYNKDLFDKYGVDYPTADWNWDDLKAMAVKLNHPEDGVWGFSTGQLNGGPDWWNWVWQNGGEFLNADGTKVLIDEPKACEAIKWWYGLVEEGLAPDGNTITASPPQDQLFPAGKVAMLYYGQWMLGTYVKNDTFKLGIAPVPAGPDGTKGLQLGGLNYAMSSKTKHPKEAWEFLKFLESSEAAMILAKDGNMIPARTDAQATWAKTYPDLDLQATFLDMMPYGHRPAFVGWEWNNELNRVLTDVWSGNIPIDQACKAAADAGNAVLAKRK